MKKIITFLFLYCLSITISASSYIVYRGNSKTFGNIAYTIVAVDSKYEVHDGTSIINDPTYTIEPTNSGYKIYKGGSTSIRSIVYIVEATSNGYKIYEGTSTTFSNVAYVVESDKDGYRVYKGNSISNNSLEFVVVKKE